MPKTPRVIATALLAALLLAAPALGADPKETVDQEACAEYCEPQADPTQGAAKTASSEAESVDTEESPRQRPVLYVPPNRGSAQARVGGATRGGHPL